MTHINTITLDNLGTFSYDDFMSYVNSTYNPNMNSIISRNYWTSDELDNLIFEVNGFKKGDLVGTHFSGYSIITGFHFSLCPYPHIIVEFALKYDKNMLPKKRKNQFCDISYLSHAKSILEKELCTHQVICDRILLILNDINFNQQTIKGK